MVVYSGYGDLDNKSQLRLYHTWDMEVIQEFSTKENSKILPVKRLPFCYSSMVLRDVSIMPQKICPVYPFLLFFIVNLLEIRTHTYTP